MEALTDGGAPQPPLALDPPCRLGPFQLVRRLGAGGMGTVYEARAEEPTGSVAEGTRVAVKVLRADLTASGRATQRLRREAELGARVRHPNVVRPLELLELPHPAGECLALVMELVEGRTLRSLMDEMGALPEPLVRHVGTRLAEGLRAVHEQGIVHRDVKPENVLLTPSQDVKLADLGIARRHEDAASMTTTGAFLGSLAYASPEHFGVGEPVPASDLYSLGVVLHEAIAGRRPFAGATAALLVRQHLQERPRALGEIVLDVSPFLEQVVLALLQKDPARRPASAAEVARLLAHGETSGWWRERQEP